MTNSTTARGGRLRRVLLRLGVLLGSTIVALLLAEGITRLLVAAPPAREERTGPPLGRTIDAPIGYELIPGVTTTWFFPGSSYSEERTIVATINQHGLRGPAFEVEKPRGVKRVLCVGDSFVFGTGVQDDETWPAQLQVLFDGEAQERSIEVWNCGIPGFDTVQEIAFLEERLLPFDPDLVVLCYYINDAQIGEEKMARLSWFNRLLKRWSKENPQGLAKHVRSVSRLAEILARTTSRRIAMSQYNRSMNLQYTEGSTGWTAVTREFVRGKQLCAERGIGFVVVLYPTMSRQGEGLASHEPFQMVLEFCRGEQIDCLDLEPVLEQFPVEEMWVHPLNMHPNSEAHAIAAEAIRSFLGERSELTVAPR